MTPPSWPRAERLCWPIWSPGPASIARHSLTAWHLWLLVSFLLSRPPTHRAAAPGLPLPSPAPLGRRPITAIGGVPLRLLSLRLLAILSGRLRRHWVLLHFCTASPALRWPAGPFGHPVPLGLSFVGACPPFRHFHGLPRPSLAPRTGCGPCPAGPRRSPRPPGPLAFATVWRGRFASSTAARQGPIFAILYTDPGCRSRPIPAVRGSAVLDLIWTADGHPTVRHHGPTMLRTIWLPRAHRPATCTQFHFIGCSGEVYTTEAALLG